MFLVKWVYKMVLLLSIAITKDIGRLIAINTEVTIGE